MSYKRLIPCIFIAGGKVVKWVNDKTVLCEDAVKLARYYSEHGADELLVFDLSDSDEDHDNNIDLMRKINRNISIPMVAGGNIKRLEDVKKILYAGAKRAMLNFSKPGSAAEVEEAAKRFGKEKIAVSLNDFDALFKHQQIIEDFTSEIIFMHRLDLNSVMNVTDIPCVILTDTEEKPELFKILKCPGVKGLSGKYISQSNMDFVTFKEECKQEGIKMTSFESIMDFSQFKLNVQGLLPVIVQHYKTKDVLMLAYMNEEAFDKTIKTGKMTYYSRSRNALWVKGETSGHFQYVKSLTIDCDKDTLLAKVDQIGAACHTGNPTCFFQPLAGTDDEKANPQRIFEHVYHTIVDRKQNPKEGSYTNYLFEKGIDKILKKVGEEATETVIAAKNPNLEELKYEVADLLYHLMVLMVERGLSWEDITQELSDRE
jgi:phosphoribosyl-ATP pyrophosphohydrolase/phosphoribosyl-AMP cyclohydrolase